MTKKHIRYREWLEGGRGSADEEDGEFHSGWQREPLLSEGKFSLISSKFLKAHRTAATF